MKQFTFMLSLVPIFTFFCRGAIASNVLWVDVLTLRPSQFSVGLREVAAKQEKLEELDKDEQRDYLLDHPVPVVIGPCRILHMLDRHHLSRALWQAGIGKIPISIEQDWSSLDEIEFWSRMKNNKWVYLYDQLGVGPHNPSLLPENVATIADDPYRSLAWSVREEGGFEKVPELFAEFAWANFFRSRIRPWNNDQGYRKAVKRGLELADSDEASYLPGYLH
ncbi:MAG: chromosome partitioning protein ParB [Deltaproteobacteria bacterium]|nr:chromosome partitioning protein ParB [Deltaproteobacteria bacterium]